MATDVIRWSASQTLKAIFTSVFFSSLSHTIRAHRFICVCMKGMKLLIDSNNPSFNYPVFSKIVDIPVSGAKRFPLKTAFKVKEENGRIINISYKKFYTDILTLASSLCKTLALRKTKIAVAMKNSYKWCVSYFAVLASDNVCVPLDRELIAEDFVHLINFGEIEAVFADEKATSLLLSVKDRLPQSLKIITDSSLGGEGVVSFEELMEIGKDELLSDLYCLTEYKSADELSVLLFTSGTTGLAKGVMLSDRNICSNVNSVREIVDISEKDSTLCVLPLHHAYQSVVMLMMLSAGGSISFSESVRHTASDLLLYKPTVFVTVPLMLEKIHRKIMREAEGKGLIGRSLTSEKALKLVSKISNTDLKRKIFSSVHSALGGNIRMIITGAAKMNEDIARDYNAFAIPVIIGYGLTECSPIAICNRSSDIREDSIGKPIPGAEAKILNPDSDGIGEILVKGPMVMLGYYKNEEETKRVLRDGWLYTGDLGCCDNNGYYYITGRKKNVIVTKNGKNIYPEEIEYYLDASPYITESLVYAEGDEDERVSAVVVPDIGKIKRKMKKGKISDEDVYSFLKKEINEISKALPSYKAVRSFTVNKEGLKRTATHKIKRNTDK